MGCSLSGENSRLDILLTLCRVSIDSLAKMAGLRPPDSPPMPDLSHLTEEEKNIIQSVMQRQQAMENESDKLKK